MLNALIREVSPLLADCQLTYLERSPINLGLAIGQHLNYRNRLCDLGLKVSYLPSHPGMADAVFVEDTAVILDEIAVITRPGATSRRAETVSVADALAIYRRLDLIRPPGTLEGGDVLRIDRTLFVGLTSRTNQDGIQQLNRIVAPFDYRVEPVEVDGCLHLKTACTYLGDGSILANREWFDPSKFSDFVILDVPVDEPWSANTLKIGETLLIPLGFPVTQELLDKKGFDVQTIEIGELQKAEAGLTCLSLIFNSD